MAVLTCTSAHRTPWKAVVLLWLSGNGLRLTILAVPPVIATIRDDLHLSATEVGLLGSIALVAAGSALRGVSSSYVVLLLTTVVMSAGVAIMQPIMPTTVRQWLPDRIGLGTAVYTNGLLVGEILAVLLTTPVILPLVGGSWRLSLVAWSLPIAIIALVVYALAPRTRIAHPAQSVPPRKWLPDWRLGLVWRLGGLFCCINAIYFAANAFVPIFLAGKGRSDLIAGALLALNLGQLPASLLLLVVAGRLERRVWPYLASVLASLASIGG